MHPGMIVGTADGRIVIPATIGAGFDINVFVLMPLDLAIMDFHLGAHLALIAEPATGLDGIGP